MLGELFSDGVVTREGDPGLVALDGEHFAEEHEAVARAVAKRRREYLAVRCLARQALEQLGVRPQALLNRADRSPIWPEGVVGSLSHTHGWCGVAVAQQNPGCLGIGIDAERVYEMSAGVMERILTSRERECLPAAQVEATQALATLVFSAKEAVYKCIYPVLGRYVGFEEVEIPLRGLETRGEFQVVFPQGDLLASVLPHGYQLGGRFLRKGDLWLTGVTLSYPRSEFYGT
jgi:4'-phosphopantetheinyl transferase EntD